MNSETCLLAGGCCEKIVKQQIAQLFARSAFLNVSSQNTYRSEHWMNKGRQMFTQSSQLLWTQYTVAKPEDAFWNCIACSSQFMFCNSVFWWLWWPSASNKTIVKAGDSSLTVKLLMSTLQCVSILYTPRIVMSLWWWLKGVVNCFCCPGFSAAQTSKLLSSHLHQVL